MMNREELAERLDAQYTVHLKVALLLREKDQYVAKAKSQIQHIKDGVVKFPKAPAVCDFELKLPSTTFLKPAKGLDPKAQKNDAKAKIWLALTGVAGLATLVLPFATGLGILAFPGLVITYLMYRGFAKASDKVPPSDADNQKTIFKEFAESKAALAEVLASYDSEVKSGLASYERYEMSYNKAYEDYLVVLKNLEEKIEENMAKLEEQKQLLEQIEIVDSNHYHLVGKMADLVRDGRADTLKEALDKAIEEDRLERNEEQRRAEEAEKLAVMKAQAEEARRHNEQMEKTARDQERATREAARQAQLAREREARDAASKEAINRFYAQKQCQQCAKLGSCRIHGTSMASGCGAFVPKSR